MSDRRYLIAALVCFLLGFWCASAMSQDFTVMGGIGATRHMGEQSPSMVAVAGWSSHAVQVEGLWTDANKYTGAGWLARAEADVWVHDLSLGAAITHRNGGPWSKDVWWVRAGFRSGERGTLRVIAEMAPGSPNREAKLEARLRFRARWFTVEYRGFVEYHAQVADGYGSGLALLVGGTF